MVNCVFLAPGGEFHRGGVLGEFTRLEFGPDLDLSLWIGAVPPQGLAERLGCLRDDGQPFVLHQLPGLVSFIDLPFPSVCVVWVHYKEVFVGQLHGVGLCIICLAPYS